MLDWLATPIDPARVHDVAAAVAWHGRLMVLAWAVLLPAGVIMARFWKVTPAQKWPNQLDNTIWWHAHIGLQYAGGLAALLALALVIAGGAMPRGLHALLGWCVVGLLAVQCLSGWLRGTKGGPTAPAPDGSLRGDHYDMTPRRRAFESIHKSAGYFALGIALGRLATGLWLANAPRWMWLVLAIWFPALAGLSLVWQRQGRAVDTYQAIWGPDPAHPGNRMQPIGWGVQRRHASPTRAADDRTPP